MPLLRPGDTVDLLAAGAPAQDRYPGIAAHLRTCGPCGEDIDGLLPIVQDTGQSWNAARLPPTVTTAAAAIALRHTVTAYL